MYADYHPYEDHIRSLEGVSKLRAYLQMVRIVDTKSLAQLMSPP